MRDNNKCCEKQERFEWTEITIVHGLGGNLILADGKAGHTLHENRTHLVATKLVKRIQE